MNILIDIGHPAQLNFLKISIELLSTEHNIYISYLKRGKLPDIIKQELPGQASFCIGKHEGSLYSILVHGNLLRMISFLKIIMVHRIDMGINGGVPLGFALKILCRRHIQYDDDIERKLTILLELISSDKLFIFPDFKRSSKLCKWKNLNYIFGLKEWAYLSPSYFHPDQSIPQSMNLRLKNYVFLREVSNKSVNYMNQEAGLICKYQKIISSLGLDVILSLEDKTMRSLYPREWIVLKEPVHDIHSLMYYARFVISSGDSMAREGAMMGVTAIFCGTRDMVANRFIEQYGLFHWVTSEIELSELFSKEFTQDQDDYRQKLLDAWTDVNKHIITTISNYHRR